MIRLPLILFALITFSSVFAQSTRLSKPDITYNFDMEQTTAGKMLPNDWVNFTAMKDYQAISDSTEKHSGKRSLSIGSLPGVVNPAYAAAVCIIPAKYEGREIEVKAYIKLQDVSNFVGLMLRIDDKDYNTLQFENMVRNKIKGTKDWAQYSVKLPLPDSAQTIFVGPILGGTGKLWIDDVQVLIDGKDISEAKIKTGYNPNPVRGIRYGRNPKAGGNVKLSNAKLYYEIYGTGEPLLLLHGNSQSIYAFSKQIPALEKKYKVIAVDTRGQGNSKDFTTGPLTYDLFADDMKQLLDSLHIAKTNILGWSDGGNTALIMAIKYPAYINKVAVMGAVLFPGTEAVDGKVLEEVAKNLKELKTQNDEGSKMAARLYTMLLNEPHISFDELKTIKSPVLVIAGQHDIILEKHTKAIAENIPNSKLLIIQGATHYAPVEKVAEFNKAVLDFFDGD